MSEDQIFTCECVIRANFSFWELRDGEVVRGKKCIAGLIVDSVVENLCAIVLYIDKLRLVKLRVMPVWLSLD